MKKIIILAILAAALVRGAVTLTVTKTPFEAFNLGVDFAPVIGTDGLSLIGVVATNIVTGQDVTSSIVAASPVPAVLPATDKVVFRVQGGADGEQVLLGVRVTDSTTGEIFEGQMMLQVKAR